MSKHFGTLTLTALAALAHFVSGQSDGSQQTALDEYVFSDESLSQYSYSHVSEYDFEGINSETNEAYQAYVINMTSGEWRTEEDIGVRAHWWHIMIIIMPDNLNPAYASNGTILVTGNKNDDNDGTGMPDVTDDDIQIMTTLATGIGMPCAVLFQVPNAPIVFSDDPEQMSRSEDEIVAYTFEQFLHDTSRDTDVVYFAMVRAAVRSMDTMTQFTEEEFGTPVNHFTITGRSKRGWTTWLTGAMDQRVAAIMPWVWDGINVQEVFHHQWRSYGGWSNAIEDYVDNHCMPHIDTPEMLALQDLIDPFHYRTRLTMPKLVITALMDEFQMPDDEQYWWDDLPSGPTGGSTEPSDGNTKWLIKSPNTEHSYDTGMGVAIPMMGTWISYLLNGWDIPYLTWEYDEDTGDVTVEVHGGEVYSAQMWFSTTCNDVRRDFRFESLDDPCECGPTVEDLCIQLVTWWDEEPLEPDEDGYFTGHLEPPSDGKWSAFVVNIQMTTEHTDAEDPMHTFFTRGESITGKARGNPDPRYPNTPPGILEFTSRGSVVPDTFPYEDCSEETCDGDIL